MEPTTASLIFGILTDGKRTDTQRLHDAVAVKVAAGGFINKGLPYDVQVEIAAKHAPVEIIDVEMRPHASSNRGYGLKVDIEFTFTAKLLDPWVSQPHRFTVAGPEWVKAVEGAMRESLS